MVMGRLYWLSAPMNEAYKKVFNSFINRFYKRFMNSQILTSMKVLKTTEINY